MHTVILTGVNDYAPSLAICETGTDPRAALADWFGELLPDLAFASEEPDAIEEAIEEAMAPTDWTALICFPLVDGPLAFTGESIGVGLALKCFVVDEEAGP